MSYDSLSSGGGQYTQHMRDGSLGKRHLYETLPKSPETQGQPVYGMAAALALLSKLRPQGRRGHGDEAYTVPLQLLGCGTLTRQAISFTQCKNVRRVGLETGVEVQ
ncbi:hypothetical protein HPB48_017655 [Haemaphysalis longicornis]|uniref:Uncharacterized protein n=1 Tax=Haemaphysalis longicornis TaxID=44386 RepID=A0A9J6FRL0_HAELO|nr:hypothetical protein HPB48_017655 [Haemaphysalis longicornis]